MRIVFVRHGHPNYKLDRLTPLGHLQAEAAAERLQGEGIERIYSSTCGRALETAEHTADRIGIPREEIVRCHFMRELHWGSRDGTPIFGKGSPWLTVDELEATGGALDQKDYASLPPFDNNTVTSYVKTVTLGTDIWLEFLGYKREGDFYRVIKPSDRTVAMFSHSGSSTALLSHLLGIPFPRAISAIRPNFTAITVIKFRGDKGDLIAPRIEILTDARHIADVKEETPQN